MGIRDRIREAQAKAKAEREAVQAAKAEQQAVADAARAEAARVAQEPQAAAAEAQAKAWTREVLGEELAGMEVTTAADAKVAIKLARLRKTEIATEKRELAAELADVREEWRGRQAGRMVTTGLGRRTGGRMVRGAIQAKRRSEKMSHAEVLNSFSDRKQELDKSLAYLERVIVGLQRDWRPEAAPPRDTKAPAPSTPTEDPMAILTQLGTMRDQGLITPEEYEAKRADVIARIQWRIQRSANHRPSVVRSVISESLVSRHQSFRPWSRPLPADSRQYRRDTYPALRVHRQHEARRDP